MPLLPKEQCAKYRGSDEPSAPGRNSERYFRNEKRSNETHASATNADARLARKSDVGDARLAFTGHLLMESRNGLVVDACLTNATGTAEPQAALAILTALPGAGHKTVGADKACDTAAFVADSHAAGVTRMWRRTSMRSAARTLMDGPRGTRAIATAISWRQLYPHWRKKPAAS